MSVAKINTSRTRKGQCWTVELGMDLTVPVDIIVHAETEDDARSDAEQIVKEIFSGGNLSHLSKFYPRHIKSDGVSLNAVVVRRVKGGLHEMDENGETEEKKDKRAKKRKSKDSVDYLADRIGNTAYSKTNVDEIADLAERYVVGDKELAALN